MRGKTWDARDKSAVFDLSNMGLRSYEAGGPRGDRDGHGRAVATLGP